MDPIANPGHIGLTIRTALGIMGGISLLTAGVTFVLTKLFDAHSMSKKYTLLTDSGKCMKEREQKETAIKLTLDKVDKRMTLGNLMLFRLWGEAKIPQSEIEALEKAVGIKVND